MVEADRYEVRSAAGEPRSSADTIFRAFSLTGLVVLVFIAGSLATIFKVFPAPEIEQAVQAGQALFEQRTAYQDVYYSDLWYPERRTDKGVTIYDPDRVQDGVTLYTTGAGAAAYLLDLDGTVLHEWRRPFSTVWTPGAGGLEDPQPDSHVYFRQAHVFPNGDLLGLYEGVGDTPYGYGIVKLDRDSNVIWSYPGRAHHQFSVAPDGKIYALTHEFRDDEVDLLGHLARPRLEDFLVVLSPEGKELKKIRLLTTFVKSRYRHIIYTTSSFALADPLHANAVKYIDKRDARNFAFGKAGQILLSFREAGAVLVLDPKTEKIVWATRGPWIGQHDPDILPNGNILLFDNYANYSGPSGVSRVIEFNPRTMEIVWQYSGTAEHPLESRIRSDQQRLANGNTLITESDGGRIFEVTRGGEIVWEFVNPVRGGKGNDRIPIISWSQRIDHPTFEVAKP